MQVFLWLFTHNYEDFSPSNANKQPYLFRAIGIKSYGDLYLEFNSSETKIIIIKKIILNKTKFKYSFYYTYFLNSLPDFHTNKGCRYLNWAAVGDIKYIQNQYTVININHIWLHVRETTHSLSQTTLRVSFRAQNSFHFVKTGATNRKKLVPLAESNF